MQVLFDYKTRLDMTPFHDALKHVGESAGNQVALALTPLRLSPGASCRCRNHWALRSL